MACSNPASIMRQVVLPEPEGPSSVRNSPLSDGEAEILHDEGAPVVGLADIAVFDVWGCHGRNGHRCSSVKEACLPVKLRSVSHGDCEQSRRSCSIAGLPGRIRESARRRPGCMAIVRPIVRGCSAS